METKHETHLRLLNADIYRMLANCFDFPIDERLYIIKEISTAISQSGYPNEEIQNMLITLNASIDKDTIVNDYSNIFIKGGVPLSESHTLQRFDSVSDVSAYYNAFGFSPKTGENPDSIMYELEFLALLLLKLVIAPNDEADDVVQKAYVDFLNEHVGEFSRALAQRIREGNAGTYFFTVSYLLEAFINQEAGLE